MTRLYHDETSLREMLDRRFPKAAPFDALRVSGGVSSLVFMVTDQCGHRSVIKQALAELAVKNHWPAPRTRILNEIQAMQAMRRILSPDCIPQILFVDESEFLYSMEAVPASAILFKALLLFRPWELDWFTTAGRQLGLIHAANPSDHMPQLCQADLSLFDSLRLDPYFRHSASVLPEFADLMTTAINLASYNRRALVHGDYSPKNMFVIPNNGRMILLDFEVMHYGNPAFDVAFFLTHPLAKAIHDPAQAERLGEGIAKFWTAYKAHCGHRGAIEKEVMILWAAIAVARVVGKSPLEYMTTDAEKNALLNWSRKIVRAEIASIPDAASRIALGR